MNSMVKENTALQWHPAFFAGLQIELAEEAQYLIFENEHQLGTKPKEIDVLVIKKDSNVAIRKNIGRIFRKHNIIEYKSPEDYLSIDDFYKVLGYGCFYKSDVTTVDAIKAREITISFVTKRYPQKVIRHLVKEKKLQIRKADNGIYYVEGDYFPIQFVVTSQLSVNENFWLHSLTNDLKETSEARKIISRYTNYPKSNLYQSVMEIIVKANKELFEEASGMCNALFDLVKDDVKERIEAEVRAEVRESVIAEVRESVKAEVRESVKAEVRESVKAEVKAEITAEIKEQTILSLVKDGVLTMDEAVKCLSLSEEDLIGKLNLL